MSIPFLIITIVSVLIVFMLYTWVQFRARLHVHVPVDSSMHIPTEWNVRTSFVKSADGKKIAYVYLPADTPKAAVILLHGFGNPGGKIHMLAHAQYLHDAGYAVAMVDTRSFAESGGSRVTLGIEEWHDAEAIYDALRAKKELVKIPIGYLGVSMGAVTAINTIGFTGKGDFLIASVPYATLDSMLLRQLSASGYPPFIFYPFLKIAMMMEFGPGYERYNALNQAHRISVPALFIAGKHDTDVDPADATRLYEAVQGKKELWNADAGHDVHAAHPDQFAKYVIEFLKTN